MVRAKLLKLPCQECNGQGRVTVDKTIRVKIPKGADSGNILRVPEEGNAGEKGAPPGDLLIGIKVRPGKVFARKGDDIHLELPISFAKAALGSEVVIPTPEEKEVKLKIPAGTQPDEVFTLKGKGMPRFGTNGSGNLEVQVKVKTPTDLSREERALGAFISARKGKIGLLAQMVLKILAFSKKDYYNMVNIEVI